MPTFCAFNMLYHVGHSPINKVILTIENKYKPLPALPAATGKAGSGILSSKKSQFATNEVLFE
jgi:hypothetical protein